MRQCYRNEVISPFYHLLLSLVSVLVFAGPTLASEPLPLKIFHVMSFDSPWRWTDGQFAGFKEGLGDINAEFQVFQMDIKSYSTKEELVQRGIEARAVIDAFDPDLLYISDDAGIEHVARFYVDSPLPIVFSGANRSLAHHGLDSSSNITGVLEYEHIPESIRLLQNLVPDAKRLAVISDTAPHWGPVIQRIHNSLPQLPGIELVAVDILEDYTDFQQRIRDYEQLADVVMYLGVFNFLDEQRRSVPYQTLQQWVVENSTRPDISFWIDRIHFGVLASVTVSELEQGIAAGKLARTILIDGRSPAELPPEPTVKGRPAISLARAKQLGINIQSTELLTSEIIMEFEWAKHSN